MKHLLVILLIFILACGKKIEYHEPTHKPINTPAWLIGKWKYGRSYITASEKSLIISVDGMTTKFGYEIETTERYDSINKHYELIQSDSVFLFEYVTDNWLYFTDIPFVK